MDHFFGPSSLTSALTLASSSGVQGPCGCVYFFWRGERRKRREKEKRKERKGKKKGCVFGEKKKRKIQKEEKNQESVDVSEDSCGVQGNITNNPNNNNQRTLIKFGLSTFCHRWRHWTSVLSGKLSQIFFQFLASFSLTRARRSLSSSCVQRAF